MDTQEVAGVEQEQIKIVWLIKGIAKRRITLEAAELQPGALSPRLIRWMEGEPRPIRVPWVVLKTRPVANMAPQETSQPPVIDMRRHVQWLDTPRIQVSWMSRETPAPVYDYDVTVLLPKRVSWEHGDKPFIRVSWV